MGNERIEKSPKDHFDKIVETANDSFVTPTHGLRLPILSSHEVLALQRRYGNRVVQRLIQRQKASATASPGQGALNEDGDKLTLRLSHFDHDSATLKPEHRKWLKRLEARLMSKLWEIDTSLSNTDVKRMSGFAIVSVNGYASQEGNARYNKRLSARRAIAVAQHIRTQSEVYPPAQGKGELESEAQSYPENRCVEVVVDLSRLPNVIKLTKEEPIPSGTLPDEVPDEKIPDLPDEIKQKKKHEVEKKVGKVVGKKIPFIGELIVGGSVAPIFATFAAIVGGLGSMWTMFDELIQTQKGGEWVASAEGFAYGMVAAALGQSIPVPPVKRLWSSGEVTAWTTAAKRQRLKFKKDIEWAETKLKVAEKAAGIKDSDDKKTRDWKMRNFKESGKFPKLQEWQDTVTIKKAIQKDPSYCVNELFHRALDRLPPDKVRSRIESEKALKRTWPTPPQERLQTKITKPDDAE